MEDRARLISAELAIEDNLINSPLQILDSVVRSLGGLPVAANELAMVPFDSTATTSITPRAIESIVSTDATPR